MKQLVRKLLNEYHALYDDILKTSDFLFDEIIKSLDNFANFDELIDNGIQISAEKNLSDFIINEFDIEFTFSYGEKFLIRSLGYNIPKKADLFNMTVEIIVPKNVEVSDLKEHFLQKKDLLISKFAHELKHAFDFYKKDYKPNPKEAAEYELINRDTFDSIPYLKTLINHLYYVHKIENLVKPAELYAALMKKNTTKKQFLKALQESEMYEKLLKISKYSTERLIDSLKTVMPQIEEYFAPFEIINPNMSDDEKISILLEHFVFTVRNFAKGEIQKMIDSDRYDINRLKKIKSKYENRSAGYMKYLNDYEKYLQTEPQKIIKKLSKVYKMLPD